MEDKYSEEKQLLLTEWQKTFKSGTDLDAWGQPVEAAIEYQKLSRKLRNAVVDNGGHDGIISGFTDDEKKILKKVATCLELRTRALQHPGTVQAISLRDLTSVQKDLIQLVSCKPNSFPINVVAAQVYMRAQANQQRWLPSEPVTGWTQMTDEDEDPANKQARGSLLCRPPPIDGRTVVTVRVDKIGLRDSAELIDSHLVISVKDRNGTDLTPQQTTPLVTQRTDSYVIFNTDVYLQRHLETLPRDFAIFFELKHYKPKKRIVSTKCWSFLEKDEIKEGSAVIELYKKPTDFKRRRLFLLTSKPLFLHLKISFD